MDDSSLESTVFQDLMWSPDASKLALTSVDVEVGAHIVNAKIQIIDSVTKIVLLTIDKWVNAIAWSPDGSELLSGGYDGLICHWDAYTGQLLSEYQHAKASLFPDTSTPVPVVRGVPFNPIRGVAFNPNGKTIASGGLDNLIRFWDIETGISRETLDVGMTSAFDMGKTINWLGWDNTGTRFACTNRDGILRVWNSISEAPLLLKKHHGALGWAAWSPDSLRIADAGSDGQICIWDSITGELQRSVQGHSDPVGNICWRSDGKYLASAGLDMTVKLWNADTGQCISTLLVTDEVWALDWASDGRLAFAPTFQYDGYSQLLPPMPIILNIDDQLPSLVIA